MSILSHDNGPNNHSIKCFHVLNDCIDIHPLPLLLVCLSLQNGLCSHLQVHVAGEPAKLLWRFPSIPISCRYYQSSRCKHNAEKQSTTMSAPHLSGAGMCVPDLVLYVYSDNKKISKNQPQRFGFWGNPCQPPIQNTYVKCWVLVNNWRHTETQTTDRNLTTLRPFVAPQSVRGHVRWLNSFYNLINNEIRLLKQ